MTLVVSIGWSHYQDLDACRLEIEAILAGCVYCPITEHPIYFWANVGEKYYFFILSPTIISNFFHFRTSYILQN
jgi:hypothetical protein